MYWYVTCTNVWGFGIAPVFSLRMGPDPCGFAEALMRPWPKRDKATFKPSKKMKPELPGWLEKLSQFQSSPPDQCFSMLLLGGNTTLKLGSIQGLVAWDGCLFRGTEYVIHFRVPISWDFISALKTCGGWLNKISCSSMFIHMIYSNLTTSKARFKMLFLNLRRFISWENPQIFDRTILRVLHFDGLGEGTRWKATAADCARAAWSIFLCGGLLVFNCGGNNRST